jgi:hypothetical protein
LFGLKQNLSRQQQAFFDEDDFSSPSLAGLRYFGLQLGHQAVTQTREGHY